MPTFRTRRYMVALLWHWSAPFALGLAAGSLAMAIQLVETLPELEQTLSSSISSACN